MFKKSFFILNVCSRRFLSKKHEAAVDWVKQDKILMEPFAYVQNLHTKYHELMVPCFDHWLKLPEQKLDAIREAVHTCVTWSMLVDDMEDDSYYRFGVPSAHQTFGVGLTLNAALKAVLLSLKQVTELGHPSAVDVFWKNIDEFCSGQGLDIYWRENVVIPTEDSQFEMIRKKGGSWFALPVELMQLFSSNKTDYSDLAYFIGIYYTMLDDYYNLFQPNALKKLSTTPKHVHYAPSNDITESKITLAVIHASHFPDVATELADILKQKTSDLKLVNRGISLLRKHGSDEYAKHRCKTLEEEIRKEIDRLGGNPKLVAYMDELSL